MSTPALSGWFDNKWKVIGADFALNSLWSASPLWKDGNDYASIWKNKDLDLTDKMARTISILGTDAFFSIATTSFKDSPDYKKMSTAEKGLFEAVVDAAQKSVSQNNPEWRAFETPQSIAQRNAAQNNGGFINVHREDVVAKKAITDIATKLETDIKKIETSDAPKPTSYEGKVLLLDTINKFKDAPQSLQISEIKKTQAAIDKGENAVERRRVTIDGESKPLVTTVDGKEYTYRDNNWYSEAGRKITGKNTLGKIQKSFAEDYKINKKDVDEYIEQRRAYESRINQEETARQAQERGEAKMPEPDIKTVGTRRILQTENKLIDSVTEMIRAGTINNKRQFKDFIRSVSDQYNLRTEQVNNIYNRAMGKFKSEQKLMEQTERASKPAKVTQQQFKPQDKVTVVDKDGTLKEVSRKVEVDLGRELSRQLRLEQNAVRRGKQLGKKEERLTQKQRAEDLKVFKAQIKEFARSVFKGEAAAEKYKEVVGRIEAVKTPSDANLTKLIKLVEEVQAKKELNIAVSKAKKVFKKVAKRAVSRDPSKRLSEDLVKAFKAIDDAVSTTKPSEATINRVNKSLEYFEKNQHKVYGVNAEKGEILLPDFLMKDLKRLTKKPLSEMTISEVKTLTASLENIIHQQNTINRLDAVQQERKITKNIDDYTKQPSIKSNQVYKDAVAKKDSFVDTTRILQLPPDQLTWTMDGWNKGGVVHKVFYDAFVKADDKMYTAEREARNILDTISRDVRGFEKEDISIRVGSETLKISKGQRISMYLDSLNAQNNLHVLKGGYVIGEVSGRPLKITLEQRDAIISKMTETELRVAETIIETYKVLSKYMDIASKDINGFPISEFNFTNPIINAKIANYSKDTGLVTPDNLASYNKVLISTNPHLQERKAGANNPIVLHDAIKTVQSMVPMVARYYGYARPLIDAKQVLNGVSSIKTQEGTKQSFKELIETNFGKKYYQSLTKLVSDLERGYRRTDDIDRQIAGLTRNFTTGTLMFNLPIATMQPISYNQAQYVMPKKYWSIGLASNPASWKEMGDNSAFLWSRSQGRYSIAYGETVRKNTAVDKALFTIKEGDRQSVGRIWNACRAWVKDERPDLEVNGKQFYAEVANRANMVVRRTQPTFELIDRPELARSDNQIAIAFSMFSSQRNKNSGLIYENEVGFRKKLLRGEATAKDFAEFVDRVLVLNFMSPLLVANHATGWAATFGVAREFFFEEEEDRKTWGEIYKEQFANKILSTLIGDRGLLGQQYLSGLKVVLDQAIIQYNKYSETYELPRLKTYAINLPVIQAFTDIFSVLSRGVSLASEWYARDQYNQDTSDLEKEGQEWSYRLSKATGRATGWGVGGALDIALLIGYLIQQGKYLKEERIPEVLEEIGDFFEEFKEAPVETTLQAIEYDLMKD